MRGFRRRRCVAVVVALFVALALPVMPVSAESRPPFVGANPGWLAAVNYYRAMAGLSLVVEDPALSVGAVAHSCYMLVNGITHAETPGLPGFTVEGDLSGRSSNVAVTSLFNETARRHVELWMTGPFHAVGVLRPNLQRVGFGKCDDAGTPKWHSGATLDVVRGLGARVVQSAPILFPGDGMTTSLSAFEAESPNPLDFCGWSGGGGLPILALMPESAAGATSTVTGPGGPLQMCTLTAANTTGSASQILGGNNAVVAMPRNPLVPGTYTVEVRTAARSVRWSFTVDPAAATAAASPNPQPAPTPTPVPPTPSPVASPTGAATGFEPMVPSRLVDTRDGFGISALQGGMGKRVQLGGRHGIPADARAASANFTVTQTQGGGYLTVWNCSPDRPVVATLNFGPGETVPNAATVPLDATGGVCVYSSASTHLIIDVSGFYRADGNGRFTSVTPSRLMDTRTPLGAPGRISAGGTVVLQVGGTNGLPDDLAAAALNVASVNPTSEGFVTVYPCDAPRPLAANLNPIPGQIKPNLVVTPVSTTGTVCLYSSSEVDLVVDVTGYLSTASPAKFTPTAPFRFTDTREPTRTDVNAGTNGTPLPAGHTIRINIAGQRAIPTNTRAISVNIAVTGADQPGFITAYPCGQRPNTANVNYTTTTAISNGAQLPLSTTGDLCIYTYSRTHLIIDINGWWS